MGLLVDGIWHDKWYDTKSSDGQFVRESAQYRHWVTQDGAAGPTGNAGFKAESGRYHLFVSLACPWAHRTLIFRQLKGLSDHISVDIVHPHMLEHGWEFLSPTKDSLYSSQKLYEIYLKAAPNYTGRVTVPILWDKHNETIVSNESADIIRMFNFAFNELTGNQDDYYPVPLRDIIDETNAFVYERINNGVYRCGFATTQSAYEAAFHQLFEALDDLEKRLESSPFLCGEQLTEADWRLFTTLVRFDPVYVGHFKCNRNRIADMPNLSRHLTHCFNHPNIAKTVDYEHIKAHYYFSHTMINPTQVIPLGPKLSDALLNHS